MEGNKAFMAVVVIQSIYAGYFVLTKLAFDVGMNTFVFVFYRQAAATLFLAPISFFFLIRKPAAAPPLSFSIFIKIFLLSLFGITMSLDVVGVALKYSSASLGAATANTLPVITFFLAVLFRMEKVNIRTSPGIMKIAGVVLCIGGVATIAFYRGPLLQILTRHHLININHLSDQQLLIQHQIPDTKTWIKGVFLMLLSNITWALWLVLQGIVVTGITFYLQAWVIEKKGPVFLAMTTPLIMVITIIISAFIFGEIITLGSILGALLLVGGLYFVLWGKTKEEARAKQSIQGTDDVEKACEG